MPEKEALVYHVLREGLRDGDGAILVSTGVRGEECWRWFRENGFGLEPVQNRVGIVDCASLSDGFPEWRTEPIRRVSSPMNFAGITRAVDGFLEEFRRQWGVRRCRLAIHSLSTLLLYSDLRAAFRFLHALNSRVRATGGLGLYALQQGMHEGGRAVAAMETLADGIVEVRPDLGLRLLRMKRRGEATAWVGFEVSQGRILPQAAPPAADPEGRWKGGLRGLPTQEVAR
jgi:KaiC/GvpD/RAD55 family RecA-like ATPase